MEIWTAILEDGKPDPADRCAKPGHARSLWPSWGGRHTNRERIGQSGKVRRALSGRLGAGCARLKHDDGEDEHAKGTETRAPRFGSQDLEFTPVGTVPRTGPGGERPHHRRAPDNAAEEMGRFETSVTGAAGETANDHGVSRRSDDFDLKSISIEKIAVLVRSHLEAVRVQSFIRKGTPSSG